MNCFMSMHFDMCYILGCISPDFLALCHLLFISRTREAGWAC